MLILPLKLGSGLLLMLTLAGYLGEFNQVFELLSHFRLQYLFAAFTFLLVFLWNESKRWAALSLLVFTINASEIFPLCYTGERGALDNSKQELTLMLSNVLRTNSGFASFIKLIDRIQPDMFIVLECDRRWIVALTALTKHYPHQSLVPREDNFGIALYSRLPLKAVDVIDLGGSGVPSIVAKIKLSNSMLTVLATHPLSPLAGQSYRLRNQQLSAIASYVHKLTGPRIVIGDLNVSPWSPYFEKLLVRSGLLNARQGHGLVPTWPTYLPFMMIPIDHFLISPDITVINIDSGPDIGSDHLPIVVRVRI